MSPILNTLIRNIHPTPSCPPPLTFQSNAPDFLSLLLSLTPPYPSRSATFLTLPSQYLVRLLTFTFFDTFPHPIPPRPMAASIPKQAEPDAIPRPAPPHNVSLSTATPRPLCLILSRPSVLPFHHPRSAAPHPATPTAPSHPILHPPPPTCHTLAATFLLYRQ